MVNVCDFTFFIVSYNINLDPNLYKNLTMGLRLCWVVLLMTKAQHQNLKNIISKLKIDLVMGLPTPFHISLGKLMVFNFKCCILHNNPLTFKIKRYHT